MSKELILDLADCTEFRQDSTARRPAIVHGTVVLLVTLLGTGLTWGALTQADLVVRATGHVRPVTTPRQVFFDFQGDISRASLGVAVAKVNYRQGNEVKGGEVLIRMDTKRLDSEIGKRELAIQAGEKELGQLTDQGKLLSQQSEKARGEAAAEFTQVEKEIGRAKTQQALDVLMAEKELKHALSKLARVQKLMEKQAAAAVELDEARLQARRAEGELEKARLPIVEEKVEVSRQKLARLEKDFLLKRMELMKEQGSKKREVDSARMERDWLERERRQAIVRAPIAGVVISREVKVGDILEPGKPVVEIAEQKGFRFEVAISSEDVAHLRVGMPARIKLDAFDYQKFSTLNGKICFITPDAKVVEGQRIAKYLVKIELEGDEVERGDLRGRVKLGMAGQTEIVTDHESLLSLLLRKIRQSISLG